MINSVLIANRGEIACRIIRTAQKLGIRTVAVYSEVDAASLAVQMADEAYPIGPATSKESYLNIENIMEAAKKANVEAIHPGYGFLAESEALARACEENGLIFIGPSIKSLKEMGSKREAKAIASACDIPLIPGFEGDQDHLLNAADKIGFPLMIKAVLGGGGKGLRLVETGVEFEEALASCKREALASFSNDEIMLEKYCPHLKHIEVQIFGDQLGNLVHLFERDCSLQRHHQKVIEEAPSSLAPALRENLYEAALKLAQATKYVGAGTVEFLVDPEGNFYFLEMNTRLQVEHPVTEAITGLDLVEWQFRVASKEKLPLTQDQIKATGHSLEMRLYAEDPRHHFKPTSGEIWTAKIPHGVRFETGLKIKDRITPEYDPMIAKLICTGNTRKETLAQSEKALDELIILGITTNIGFLQTLLRQKDVRTSKSDTGYIDRNLDELLPPKEVPEEIFQIAALVSLDEDGCSPWNTHEGWRLEGYAPQTTTWDCEGKTGSITLTYSDAGWREETNGLLRYKKHENTLTLHNTSYFYWKRKGRISLYTGGRNFTLIPYHPPQESVHKNEHQTPLNAPMTGRVSVILVKEGDRVSEDQSLLVLEAMKMEHMIRAPRDGKIKQLFCQEGESVEEGFELVELSE